MNESLWVTAKRTFTIPAPWPLNPQVVNELLWVAAKRTFTSPSPWPLVRLVSGVVNELLWGGGQKNVHRPWPLAPLFSQLTVPRVVRNVIKGRVL